MARLVYRASYNDYLVLDSSIIDSVQKAPWIYFHVHIRIPGEMMTNPLTYDKLEGLCLSSWVGTC